MGITNPKERCSLTVYIICRLNYTCYWSWEDSCSNTQPTRCRGCDPSKLCMPALHAWIMHAGMHAACMPQACSACMRHASKLAHLHAFSCMNEECMHASGMKISMHMTILEQLIMHENACRICMHALIRWLRSQSQQSRFRARGS